MQAQQGRDDRSQGGLSWSQPPVSPPAKPSQQKPPASTSSGGQKPPALTSAAFGGMTSPTSFLVWAFIAGLIIGALAVWAWLSFGTTMVRTTSSTSTTTQMTGAATSNTSSSASAVIAGSSNSSVSVPSPQGAGLQVAISRVSVSLLTWVVVYENRGGVPGNVLGTRLFDSSTQSGTVDLLRGTLPGQTYFVGESRDDGDRIFTLANDPPVRDFKGDPTLVEFQTK